MDNTELFREYDRKMTELYNDSPIYDPEELFGIYRIHHELIMAEREGRVDDDWHRKVKAFAALSDALKPRKDAPEKIVLWPEGVLPERDIDHSRLRYDLSLKPYMYAIPFPKDRTPKGAVLCVAGGSHGRAVVYEGFGSALLLTKQGYQTFVIHNRINTVDFETREKINDVESGTDVSRAIRWIRAHAGEYRIPEGKVAAAGFSNGGLTIENCIRYFSGTGKMTDYYPDYQPDRLDEYYGSPDGFLCIYGPRFNGDEFDYTGVVYPPTFYAVGREDSAMENLNYVYFQQLKHGVPVEIHTFAGTPHGKAGYGLISEKEDHPNFDLWVELADYFLQDAWK